MVPSQPLCSLPIHPEQSQRRPRVLSPLRLPSGTSTRTPERVRVALGDVLGLHRCVHPSREDLRPAFGAAINNYSANTWYEAFWKLETDDREALIARTFEQIPKDRAVVQFLVDEYCHNYQNNGERDEGTLPREFLLRCMRRLKDMASEPQGDHRARLQRCYLEHTIEGEKEACPKLHMRFDQDVGHGYFE